MTNKMVAKFISNTMRIHLLFPLFLVSCTAQWTRQGFDIQQWHGDDATCTNEAAMTFPPQFNTYQLPGYTSPVQTNCSNVGGYVNCSSYGGQSYPINVTQDLNESNRKQAWERCIRARGYYRVSETPPALASDTNSNPLRNADVEYKTAYKALCSKPEFSAFQKKSPCEEDTFSFQQLSDKSKAGSSEKILISKFRDEEKVIEAKVVDAFSNFGGKKGADAAILMRKFIDLEDQIYLKLLERKMTFGEFNKRRQELKVQFEEEAKDFRSGHQ